MAPLEALSWDFNPSSARPVLYLNLGEGELNEYAYSHLAFPIFFGLLLLMILFWIWLAIDRCELVYHHGSKECLPTLGRID